MNKSLSWKELLIGSVVLFVVKYFINFGTILGTALDFIAPILFILGIVGLVKHLNLKNKTKHLKRRKDGRIVFVAGRGRRKTNIWEEYTVDRRN